MPGIRRIQPSLWFDNQAEAAAAYYVGIFPRSKIGRVSRYPEVGKEVHGQLPGSVMTVEFELDGQPFTALNGGPVFQFNEAISFQIFCDTAKELDHYWDELSSGGDPKAQQCGWLKDRFGVSWQVIPSRLPELMADPDPSRAGRVMAALLKMKKLNFEELERAYQGEPALAGSG